MAICCCATRYNLLRKLRYIPLCVMRYDMDPVTITCRRHISHRRYIALFAYLAFGEDAKSISRIRRIHIAVALSARQTAIFIFFRKDPFSPKKTAPGQSAGAVPRANAPLLRAEDRSALRRRCVLTARFIIRKLRPVYTCVFAGSHLNLSAWPLYDIFPRRSSYRFARTDGIRDPVHG